jgi:hypothetical protein
VSCAQVGWSQTALLRRLLSLVSLGLILLRQYLLTLLEPLSFEPVGRLVALWWFDDPEGCGDGGDDLLILEQVHGDELRLLREVSMASRTCAKVAILMSTI